ncbi:MAG: hypothetical protein VZS44_00585 [Bacilli bacterium]|nr:hypothetical protein [Bacilli bacterium]
MKELQDNIVDVDKVLKMLDSTSFARNEANKDKENFEKYKKNEDNFFDEDILDNMRLLDLLQRLGYPMEELGTYLFKDVIYEVYNYIKDDNGDRDDEKCSHIMKELSNPFSSFYLYIAREWKELGIKPFHLFIRRSQDNIDYKSIDKGLVKKIYGNNMGDSNYGFHAFQIAAYALDKSSFVDTLQYQHKVKELIFDDIS